jgi:archaellum biogenesis protein FlaJ (TadC family)
MQHSSSTSPTVTGQLISTFHHGKGFLVFMLLFAIVMLGLAGFVLYLGTLLPTGSSGANTSRGPSPQLLIYSVCGLLVVISAVLFGLYTWQKKLRGTHYEIYEHGIVAVSGKQQQFTAFAEIEDLYLFGSGQPHSLA